MEILVWAAHVSLAIVLIVLVLLQHGKGADMGAAFGSGSAGSLFGASGSATFLSRATSFVAAMFFVTSLSLTYFSMNQTSGGSVMGSIMDGVDETESAAVTEVNGSSTSGLDHDVPEAEDGSIVNKIPE
ncbi:preprotein translocase subunit SecG [Nitrosomonas ureae]|uniref:Protein-export membrane protein SecG n=1 Tax=Nitrosomonas ureae TaxID=44577 RepID=A0A1H5XRI9_9PROT|nr:preprotein translocase subunit SecG [Nitrosomonas ureae]SEG14409.1 protein translocase subunit secG [Nitrosomonas ureae]